MVDVFLLFVLLLFFTFYKDLSTDIAMSQLLRLILVYVIGHVLLSGLHLLAYHRHDDSQAIKRGFDLQTQYVQFPAWRSYTIFGLKFCWFFGFVLLAVQRKLIPWFL